MTGNSPNFPARLNIIPDATYAYYIWSEQTKTINKKEIQNKEISKNPQDVALIGMYYYAQNPPQLEEAIKYFNSAYELLPANKRELQDGLDLETFQILVGKDRLSEKEKIKRSFAQDPLVLITNILTQEQQIKEDLAFLEERKKLQKTNNLVTVRKIVPIPLKIWVIHKLFESFNNLLLFFHYSS